MIKRPIGVWVISVWLGYSSVANLFQSFRALDDRNISLIYPILGISRASIGLVGIYFLFRLKAIAAPILSILVVIGLLDIYLHIIGFYSDVFGPMASVLAVRLFVVIAMVSYVWWYKSQGVLK